MTILRKNSDNILNLYRKIVMGDTILENTVFILVPKNFKEELETYYSPKAYAECSKEE
jgi:hypothetical protein